MLVSSLTSSAAVAPPLPVPSTPPADVPTWSATPLDPAVKVDIRGDAAARREDAAAAKAAASNAEDTSRIFIDQTTKAVVYQVLNPASGDVVFQLPNPVVLKARGYEATQARSAEIATTTVDRQA